MKYKDSGVDIDKGDRLVDIIKRFAPSIGGFSGLIPIDTKKYKKPMISASTDGVGTKLKIAQLVNKHGTVGIDLVAMSVNDIITSGAKPILFLDYFATGKLELGVAAQVIRGINEGCKESDCILLGGETAEMPGFYRPGEYDLAGFAVGIVEKDEAIDGSKVKAGDVILGLPSSGVHSNGYSLVRKVLGTAGLKKHAKALLVPTRLYVRDIMKLLSHKPLRGAIHAISHITGGGLYDNIERLLPENCQAVIYSGRWKVPEIFKVLQAKGKIRDEEMHRVFNMGIGMSLIVGESKVDLIRKLQKDSIIIGEIVKGKCSVRVVFNGGD